MQAVLTTFVLSLVIRPTLPQNYRDFPQTSALSRPIPAWTPPSLTVARYKNRLTRVNGIILA